MATFSRIHLHCRCNWADRFFRDPNTRILGSGRSMRRRFSGVYLWIFLDLERQGRERGFGPRGSQQHRRNFLGRFRLNCYTFEAYEQNGLHGNRELHLVSFRKIGCEQEAALIRYLVNEGLIEELWPQMSRKIMDETGWAFLV